MPQYKCLNEHLQLVTKAEFHDVEAATSAAISWNRDHPAYPTRIFMVVNTKNNGDCKTLSIFRRGSTGAIKEPKYGRSHKL